MNIDADIAQLLPLISVFCSIFGAVSVIAAISYGFFRVLGDALNRRGKRKEAQMQSFAEIVQRLSSPSYAEQLSAAILLRRFYRLSSADLHQETTNVISSLLRTLPTGVLQKSLGDGLAYGRDLSSADLQNTNLQGVYLGTKGKRLKLRQTDCYCADLSYALLENLDARSGIFYHANLLHTTIKNSDFRKANFCAANLSFVTFKNVLLDGADFSQAVDVPEEIRKHLKQGIYVGAKAAVCQPPKNAKTIFFSMPSRMSREDELLTIELKRFLETRGHKVAYYTRDDYPNFGQFNEIRKKVLSSYAMVAFGFKQTYIQSGTHRPGTTEERDMAGVWLPTLWNDVEVGMGLLSGMPILLVRDREINSGIFDPKLNEFFIATVTSEGGMVSIAENEGVLRWLATMEPAEETPPPCSIGK